MPDEKSPLFWKKISSWTTTRRPLKQVTRMSTWWPEILPRVVPDIDWKFQVTFIFSTVTCLWVLMKLWRSVRERQIRIIPASWNGIHAHQWSLIQCLTHRATCCVCRSLIVDAMFCDSCGVCLDFSCYESYMSKFKFRKRRQSSSAQPMFTIGQCKTVSMPSAKNPAISSGDTTDQVSSSKTLNDQWKHEWIHGNLQTRSKCVVCTQYCDIEETEHGDTMLDDHTLYNYRCCWCQRVVHEKCYENSPLVHSGRCDFGDWARYILPPFCLHHKRVWSSRARGRVIVLDSLLDFRSVQKQWTPLFVVANRKSGNNDAGNVLRRFQTVLNPLQVIDLSQDSSQLSLALQICAMLPKGVQCRFLVAGGDGTVGWVLNSIRQMELDPPPPVAIYPLGTGNDLARVLNWMGQSLDSTTDSDHLERNSLLKHIFDAHTIRLDRWTVDIKSSDSRLRTALLSSLHIPASILPRGNRDLFMYNYFSVGVDALVALNFHETRKGWLYKFLFTNTLVNKFIYFTYGTKDLLERRCANLHTRVRLELDNVPIELPQLEAILVLNISSYGGGVKFSVPDESGAVHSTDDQLIEVFGLCSSLHIGQIMVGLSSPIFLGQAKCVRLQLLEHLPVQVDGEPWLQAPANIDLSWNSHANVLKHGERR